MLAGAEHSQTLTHKLKEAIINYIDQSNNCCCCSHANFEEVAITFNCHEAT